MSAYRVLYGMNGSEYPMIIHIPTCRRLLGDGQLAINAGSIADLNTSIATNTESALPYGIPTTSIGFKPSTPIGPEQEQLRTTWSNWVTPYGNLGAFTTSGNYWKLKNGSKIIVKSVSVGSLPVAYTSVTLEFLNSQGVKCYNDLTLNPLINAYSGGIDFYFLPFLYTPNDGYYINYTIINASPNSANAGIRLYSPISTELGRTFWDGVDPMDEDDPYPDDDSDDDYPDGPDGVPDPDPVPVPPDPDIDILDSGFITLYAPTLSQVRNLAHYMWSSLFDLNTFKKIFADPMDCILGFNILPMTVPHSGSGAVMVGNISTNVTMNLVSKQWVTVDCGTLNIGAIYDTYLDYAPYTKWSIYLPFIGLQQLSADDVAHRSLHLVYRVDVLSCACVAYLKSGDQVLYQYSGSCGYSIPLTSNNFASMISNIVGIATTAGSLIASGGVTAPMAIGAGASLANNVMGLKPDIKRGGSIGASAGLMGIQTPYIIVEVPNICKPTKQHHYLGYPSFITKTVNDVSGYVEFESIVLSGVTCTDSEREQIEQILKGGCYV